MNEYICRYKVYRDVGNVTKRAVHCETFIVIMRNDEIGDTKNKFSKRNYMLHLKTTTGCLHEVSGV